MSFRFHGPSRRAGLTALLIGTLLAPAAHAADIGTAEKIARDFTGRLIGKAAAAQIFTRVAETKAKITVFPAACATSLGPRTVDENAADLTAGEGADAVWSDIGGLRACKNFGITVPLPGAPLEASLFFTGVSGEKVPVGHLALTIKKAALNAGFKVSDVFKDYPVLGTDPARLTFSSATAVLSYDQAEVELKNLAGDLKDILTPFQDEDDDGEPTGKFTLEQGVNFYGGMDNPKSGHFAEIASSILPGLSESDGEWVVQGTFGGDMIELLLDKVRGFAQMEAPDYEDKKSLAFSIQAPGFTPFPFDHFNRPEVFHVQNTGTTFSVDVEKSQAKGEQSDKLNVSIESENDYTLLGNTYPITTTGAISWDGTTVTGELSGEYALPGDPLDFVNGIQVTHLVSEGGVEVTKEKDKDAEFAFSAGIGLKMKVGAQPIKSKFTVNLAEAGGNLVLTDAYMSLGSADDDNPDVAMRSIPAFRSIPFINEWTLNEGILGFTPKGKSDPDFYVSGGATWTRTGLGGRFAVMTKGGKFYLFARRNGFSLANLLPKDAKFQATRNVLTVLSVPEALLVATNDRKKEGTLATDDIPGPLQDMFDGFVSASSQQLRVYGDGFAVTSKIVFPDGKDNDLSRAFSQLGMGGFGADKPLLLSGAVGGITTGKPKISLGVAVPAIRLPDKLPGGKPNPFAKVVHPGGMEFYLALEGDASPQIEVGLKGGLGLTLPDLSKPKGNTKVEMEGRLFFKADPSGKAAVQVAGKLNELPNAFGIPGLTYKDAAFTVAAAAQAGTSSVGLEIGVGGDTIFKSKDNKQARFAADLYLGAGVTTVFPFVTPQAFGINLGATQLTPEALILAGDVLMRGVLAGPMSQAIVNALPDKKAKAAAQQMQAQIKKMSLGQIIQVDKIPLPLFTFKPVKGAKMAQFYFATPGVEIPGREDSGLNEAGLFTNSAVTARIMGKEMKIGESKLHLSASGLELYGKVPPWKIGALAIGKKGKEPTIDIKATTDGLPHFKMKGLLELKPVLHDEVDLELSKDAIRFVVRKKLASVFDFELDARTDGKDVTSSRKFNVKARLQNDIDKLMEDSVLPGLGVPKPVVQQLRKANPFLLKDVQFEGDLVAFLQGKSMKLTAYPQYFGDKRKKPLVIPITGASWKDPMNVMGNARVVNAFLADFVDYLSKNPKKTPPMRIGPVAFKAGYFGGRKLKNRKTAFVIKGGMQLPASAPATEMVFDQKTMSLTFTDNILNGLIKTDFRATGKMVKGLPTQIKFVGKTQGDLNKWLRDQVTGGLGNNPVSQAINREIARADLVTITKTSLSGDFEKYFLKGRKADLNLTVRVLGKYQRTKDKKRVKHFSLKVPIYAAPTPQNIARTTKAIAPAAAKIAKLLIDDAALQVAGALRPVGQVFKNLANAFKGPKLSVRPKAYHGKYFRLRKMSNGQNRKVKTDVCLENMGATAPDTQIRVNGCNGASNQIFQAVYEKSGNSFMLRNVASAHCLDIRGTANGGAVTQNKCKPARKSIFWTFGESASKIGVLINSMTKRCLDLKDGNKRTGQGMITWKCVGNLNQYFWLDDVTAQVAKKARPAGLPPIFHGGVYAFRAVHSKLCLDNGGSTKNGQPTHQWPCSASNSAQQWFAHHKGGKWFELKPLRSNKCLDVDAGALRAAVNNKGQKIQQWDCNGVHHNQQWEVVHHTKGKMKGTVSLRSRQSNRCLDQGVGKNKGGKFHQWDCHWGPNQRFNLSLVR